MLQGLLKFLFRYGSRIAPRTAGKLAFVLFCTPVAPSGKGSEYRKRLALASEVMASGEKQVLDSDGVAVATWFFRTREPQQLGYFVLIHGWSSRAAFMVSLVEPILSLGYNVVLVDLPAHGESSGKRLNLPMGVDALHAVQRHYGQWTGIVAHSFGGIVATSLVSGAVAGRAALPCSRLVLISAPESVPKIFSDFAQFLGLTQQARESLDNLAEKVAGRAIGYYRGAELLKPLEIPTLVLHAQEDKEVSYESAEQFKGCGQFVRLVPVSGAGHRRILTDTRTIMAISDFLQNAVAMNDFSADATLQKG